MPLAVLETAAATPWQYPESVRPRCFVWTQTPAMGSRRWRSEARRAPLKAQWHSASPQVPSMRFVKKLAHLPRAPPGARELSGWRLEAG